MSSDNSEAGSGGTGHSDDDLIGELPVDLESDDFIDSLLSAVESRVVGQREADVGVRGDEADPGPRPRPTASPASPSQITADAIDPAGAPGAADSVEAIPDRSGPRPTIDNVATRDDAELADDEPIAADAVERPQKRRRSAPITAGPETTAEPLMKGTDEPGFLEEIDEDLFGEALGLEVTGPVGSARAASGAVEASAAVVAPSSPSTGAGAGNPEPQRRALVAFALAVVIVVALVVVLVTR